MDVIGPRYLAKIILDAFVFNNSHHFLAIPPSMQQLSSLTRDQPVPQEVEARRLNHWTTSLLGDRTASALGKALWVFLDEINDSEKALAPHSSALAWTIPWMEEPGGLQSMGSRRVGHDWATSLSLFTFMHWRRKWQPTPVFLPGESQGWGRTESDTPEVT